MAASARGPWEDGFPARLESRRRSSLRDTLADSAILASALYGQQIGASSCNRSSRSFDTADETASEPAAHQCEWSAGSRPPPSDDLAACVPMVGDGGCVQRRRQPDRSPGGAPSCSPCNIGCDAIDDSPHIRQRPPPSGDRRHRRNLRLTAPVARSSDGWLDGRASQWCKLSVNGRIADGLSWPNTPHPMHVGSAMVLALRRIEPDRGRLRFSPRRCPAPARTDRLGDNEGRGDQGRWCSRSPARSARLASSDRETAAPSP